MMKIFTHFKNEEVKHNVSKFIAEHRDESINKEYEVVYVDDYEDAEYGTVYAVTNFELELIGVFAKHEPLTYREVVEGIYEDVGEQKDVVLFDITEYTGADYNSPRDREMEDYFKGNKQETKDMGYRIADAIERDIRDNAKKENMEEYFKGYEGETDAFLEESIRDSDELSEYTPLSNPFIKEIFDDAKKENSKADKEDAVNQPSHYTSGDIEVITYIEQQAKVMYESGTVPPEVIPHICNAIKYISRFQSKGKPVEDLNKSIYYINRAIKKIEDGD